MGIALPLAVTCARRHLQQHRLRHAHRRPVQGDRRQAVRGADRDADQVVRRAGHAVVQRVDLEVEVHRGAGRERVGRDGERGASADRDEVEALVAALGALRGGAEPLVTEAALAAHPRPRAAVDGHRERRVGPDRGRGERAR